MRLSDTLNRHGQAVQVLAELADIGALAVIGSHIVARYPPMSMAAFRTLNGVMGNPADCIETYSFGKLVSEGVKLFRPTQDQLEMLEQMRLNVLVNDYEQPFPTVCIEFPPDYIDKKRIHCPQEGQWYYGQRVTAEHRPGYVIVRQDPGCIFVTVVFSSDLSIKVAITGRSGQVEEIVEGFGEQDNFRNCMETTPEEWAVTKACVRSALNYCLLLDEIGCRPLPADRPLKKEHGPWRAQTGRDLPTRYELQQEVELHRSVERYSDLPTDEGRVMPPHHRRGHYRFQKFGENLCKTKRIRIAPIFVNSHLFLGKMSNTKATYT